MVLAENITIVAVKWGDKYDAEHFNVLERMVRSQLHSCTNFVVMTNEPAGIKSSTIPLPYDLPGSWGKVALFAPNIEGVNTEYVLALDVDIVITGSLDPIVTYPGDLVMYIDGDYTRGFNPSVLKLKVGSRAYIWEEFEFKRDNKIYGHSGILLKGSGGLLGDQGYINSHIKCDVGGYPLSWIQSYKWQKLEKSPADSRIVVFHGIPKPWDLLDSSPWIKDFWR